MKDKDTSILWAETGAISSFTPAEQNIGFIPNTSANAPDVNFKLNDLESVINSTNDELINLLTEASITPNPADNTQIKQALDILYARPANYINGLNITWVDATTVQISGGGTGLNADECIADDGSLLSLSADTNAVLSGASASTSYYLFIGLDGTSTVLEWDSNLDGSGLINIDGAKRMILPIYTDSSGNISDTVWTRNNNSLLTRPKTQIFLWSGVSGLPTTQTNLNCGVPLGFKSRLDINIDAQNNTSNLFTGWVTDINTTVEHFMFRVIDSNGRFHNGDFGWCFSDTSGNIQHRYSIASITGVFNISLRSFETEL